MKKLIPLFTVLFVALIASVSAKDKDKYRSEEKDRSDKKEKSHSSDRPPESSKSSSHSATPVHTPKPTASPTPAQSREPMTRSAGYEVFTNVRTKNIFDPSRRGVRIETPPSATSSSSSSRGRSLALTGTMVTEGKALAFFGGSAAEGNRVLSVGSSVANYKVTAIAPTRVELERDGKALVLDIGRQVSFDGASGESSAAEPIVEAAAHPATADTTGMPSLPAMSGDKADILRRMMERRAKESGR